MIKKEYISLIEENMLILNWLHNRVGHGSSGALGYSKVYNMALIKLAIDGGANLKEIARREKMSTPALCQIFRRLEQDGLVLRKVGSDRRNTWYQVSAKGMRQVSRIKQFAYSRIAELFRGLSVTEEAQLTAGLQSINSILKKVKERMMA